jgi:hypothetical protein
MPGKKYKSIKWPKLYEKLKLKYGKSAAAAISNAAAKKRKGKARGKRRG